MTAPAVPRETKAPRPVTVLDDVLLELVDVGHNVRVDPGELEELAASIRTLGVLEPIKVTTQPDGRYRAVFGQRRVLASRLAGQLRIPAIIEPPSDVDEHGTRRSLEQLVENLQRADLNPIDEAIALREVLDADPKLTQDGLADQIGRSRPWVSNTLGLLESAPAVQDAIRSGSLTAAHAKALRGLGVEDQAELAAKAIAQTWSAHDTERQAKWAKDTEKQRAANRKTAELHASQAIALLEKVANRKTATVGVADYSGGGTRDILKADGWTVVDGYNGISKVDQAGACGCKSVWRVDVPYGANQKVSLDPGCQSKDHQAAVTKAREARWAEENARRQATQAAEREVAKGRTARLHKWLAAHPKDLFSRHLLIYLLSSENDDDNLIVLYLSGEDEAAHDAREDALWDAILAIPDDELDDVLAMQIAEQVDDSWRVSKTVHDAIDKRVPPPKAKGKKAAASAPDLPEATIPDLLAAGIDVDVNDSAEG